MFNSYIKELISNKKHAYNFLRMCIRTAFELIQEHVFYFILKVLHAVTHGRKTVLAKFNSY